MLNGNSTTHRSITELDGLTSDLTGSETIPLVFAGKTYRRLWSKMFGESWFAVLRASFASLVAPDAIRADQSDAALYADDAAAVNGVSLVEGPGDAVEEITLKPGDSYMVPKGSFEFYVVASDSTALADFSCLADDPRAPGFWMLKANFFSGLILSDGHSKKIVNAGTKSHILVIRVVAHKA